MGLLLGARVELIVDGVETHRLSGKEKVPGSAVSKEGDAVSLLGRKGPIAIDFHEKGATVNGTSYCQLRNEYSPYLLNDLIQVC